MFYVYVGEVAGVVTAELHIKPELLGYVIGKKGIRIQETQKNTGVTSINIENQTGKITIFGPTMESVESARQQLDIDEERHDLSDKYVEYYHGTREGLQSLQSLLTASGLIRAFVVRNTKQMIFVGTKLAIKSGTLMLMAQVSD